MKYVICPQWSEHSEDMRQGFCGGRVDYGDRPLIAINSVCTVIWMSEAAGSLGWNNMQVNAEGDGLTLNSPARVFEAWVVCVSEFVWSQITRSVINNRTAVMSPR